MNYKKILCLIMIAVFGLTAFSSCGEANKGVTNTTENTNLVQEKTITLVGGDEENGFVQSMKKGAEEAAGKYGYSLDFVGVDEGTVNAVASHIASIGKAINAGTAGVVIVPDGEGYSEIYSRLYDEKIPVVQIGYVTEEDFEAVEGNKKNPVVSTVATDYRQAGAISAEKLFEKVKEDIKKTTEPFMVGVIKREDSISDEEKSEGFVEKFTELADADPQLKDKYSVETEAESSYEASFNELTENDAKAIFITHTEIADKISDVVMSEPEKYKEIVFCGFDSGAKQLKWMSENEGFIGGVAQDSFNLGYNAIEQCIFAIEKKDIKETIKIEAKWYDKLNVDKMKQDNIVFDK